MIDVKKVEQTLNVYFVSDDHMRPAMNGIYNNGGVVAATNGHLFAEVDLTVWPQLSEIKDSIPVSESFPDYEAKAIIPLPERDKTYRADPERLFTNPDDIVEGDTESSEPCNMCGGDGSIYHDCSCEYCDYHGVEDCWKCDGAGKIYINAEHSSYTHVNNGRFRSIYLNRVVLLFRCFGITDVEIYQQSKHSVMLIKGAGVTCVVAPVLIGDLQDDQSIVHEITIGNQEVTA